MATHPEPPRSRWWSGWAPTATPPTVPWAPASRAFGGIGAEVERLVRSGVRVGLEAGAQGVRDAMAAWGDPVRRHAKQVRRVRRKVAAETTVAGGLGALALTAGIGPGLDVVEVGLGGAAAVVGMAALGAAGRLRELRRNPPAARSAARPARLPRPPRDCPSRGPLDRLAERERALAGLLAHLGPAGDESRAVAASAAVALRDLGARTSAVHQARRGAGPAAAGGLDTAVAALVERLEAGVAAYDALVVAAADAVAAAATLQAGDPVLLLRLTEATDSLAGLAAGLREVSR